MQDRKNDKCALLIHWLCRLVAVACAALGAHNLHAHQAPDRVLDAVRLHDTAPQIDGVLDDMAWQDAPPLFTGFVQRDPEEGQAASEKTTVQLVYDDEALYIAIMAYDSEPDKIVSRLVRRDQWTEADCVQVTFDTHHDHQTGYSFLVYASGSINDGVLKNDDWGDDTWNGVWESAHALGAKGWSVEYKIPFHNLRFSGEGNWGVNIARYISRKKERIFWVMVPSKENGWVSRFTHLEGLEDIASKRSLEILPYRPCTCTLRPQRHIHPRRNRIYHGAKITSMPQHKLSLAAARRLSIRTQGLDNHQPLAPGKEGAAQVVERLGYIQIDTIAVIERAHNHIIWNRHPDYAPQMLGQLLAEDRRVFEYWTHAAAYVPIADYRHYLPRMASAHNWKREARFRRENPRLVKEVYERIRRDGAMASADFDYQDAKRGTWWDWKPVAASSAFTTCPSASSPPTSTPENPHRQKSPASSPVARSRPSASPRCSRSASPPVPADDDPDAWDAYADEIMGELARHRAYGDGDLGPLCLLGRSGGRRVSGLICTKQSA